MKVNNNKNSNSTISTIGGFEYLESFIERIKLLDSSLYLFRGQKNQEWKLLSTSHRKLNKNGGTTNSHEDVIKDNVDLISDYKLFGYGQDKQNIITTANATSSDLVILAQLRHLGAANLLLDFTSNALIALWFACEEDIGPDENGKETADSRHLKHKAKSKDGAVFLLPVEDAGKYFPLSKFDQVESFNLQESLSKDTAYYWKTSLLSRRIIAQNSYFVIGSEIPFDENTGKIIVPASQKQSIRSALDKLAGISELSLFPDEEGFAVAYSDNASHTKTENGHARIALGKFFSKDISSALAMRKALEHYTAVLNFNPRSYIAYNNRGLAHAKTGNLPEAIKDFDSAISVNSDYYEAYYNRGATMAESGKIQEAIADYDKAIELKSNYAKAYNDRGLAYVAIGSFQDAIKNYDKAIEINSNYAEAYYNRANLQVEIGNIQKAIMDLDKAIGINSNYAKAYNNRGIAKSKTDKVQEAIADFDKAIEININYSEAYNNRGNAYFEIGRLQEAIADFDKAIKLDNNYADAYYNRGTAKEEMGNFQEELKDYVIAHDLFLEQEQLKSAKKTQRIIDILSQKA